MELLILIQTLKLDSAGRITAVVPYLCYGRSDKKTNPAYRSQPVLWRIWSLLPALIAT